MGNGQRAMGNGQWAMGIKQVQERNARTIRGFLPCPMPDAPCPMPHAPLPIP
ncbi:hypothetical protein [Tolypothrix sp. VBCCA 56010]|uniref:hypothetical protein n=1 Tax=Tolypothrix sp. VBCCA 56010 TaxID=3137731 RepID=UPI003D7D43E5